MRRTATVSLLLVVLLVSVGPPAQAGEPPLVITPYQGGPDYYAVAGQEVIIRARWGACNHGLTRQFINAAAISMEISLDGAPWLAVEPPARGYWGAPAPYGAGNPAACVMHTGGLWLTEWFYSLGPLEAGEYAVHFIYALTRQVLDGGDYDGDGRMDRFSGVLQDRTITIHVN